MISSFGVFGQPLVRLFFGRKSPNWSFRNLRYLDWKITPLVIAEPLSPRAQITGPCDLNRRPRPRPKLG